MTSEFGLHKERHMVTPRQIADRIGSRLVNPQSVFESLPPDVVEKLAFKNGNPKKLRIDRFLRQIQKCLDCGFTSSQLLQMDEGCITNSGQIKKDRLRDILSGKFDD